MAQNTQKNQPLTASFGLTLAALASLPSIATAQTSERATWDQVDALQTMAMSMSCPTHDGYGPSVLMMPSDAIYTSFGVRLGQADLSDAMGYRTVLDSTVLPRASELLRSFVSAHECAHHTLNHTLDAYNNGFVPTERFWEQEHAADCEALRIIARDYGYSGEDTVRNLFAEMEDVLIDITGHLSISDEEKQAEYTAIPERIQERTNRVLTRCPRY